jgi:hypothetical protein
MERYRRLLMAAAIATTALTATATATTATTAGAVTCTGGASASRLNATFAGQVEGIAGADYQRAFRLPDGRRLWVFQDAFMRTAAGPKLVHNVGLVQAGRCFRLLRSGTAASPAPWIGSGRTAPFHRWFWPLGGAVAADGTFRLFIAEMIERGSRYLSNSEPVRTWMATISLPSLRVLRLRPASDASPRLYGWSVVHRGAFTYLFGHCYRQFGWSFLGHDPCAADVRVARVPRGRLSARPTYWNGSRWTSRARRAVSVAPLRGPRGEPRRVNPMQIGLVNGCWISVTKVDDWYGDKIYLDHAPSPVGPWTTAAVIPATPLGPSSTHNTYFASLIASSATNRIIGLSNNRWDGHLSSAYRPTFIAVPHDRWRPCGR